MDRSDKLIFLILVVLAIFAILGAAAQMGLLNDANQYNVNITEVANDLTIDMANWSYDEKNDIYYQMGIVYCTHPETTEYESLGIYVPGEYFHGKLNHNGTYTCTEIDGHKGNFSGSSAPIVMPVNTPGYSAHKSSTSYNANEVKDYIDAGFIYVDAGCRGRENGKNYSGGAP